MKPAIWTGMYSEQPLDEAVRTLAGHGWTCYEASTEHLVIIETDDAPGTRIDEVRACLDALGHSMPQAHALLHADVANLDLAQRQRDIERVACHISIASALGVEVIVVHPGGRGAATTRAERDRQLALNVDAFRRLGDMAADRGMRIGLENLMRRYRAPYELLDLIGAIGHPAIGVTFDTSHANVVGLDLPAMVRELGEHLIATHISDNDGSGDQHRTPGNGKIDWLPVVEALRTTAFAGILNFEIPGECHAQPALRALQSRLAFRVANWLTGALPGP